MKTSVGRISQQPQCHALWWVWHAGRTMRIWRAAAGGMLCLLVSGCQPPAPPRLIDTGNGNDLTYASRVVGRSLAIANYSDEGLGVVYLDGVWAANMLPRSSGNGGTCCVELPLIWQRGTRVRVSYQTSSMFRRDPSSLREREVFLPWYPPFGAGGITFMYFPDDEVRLVAAPAAPGGAEFGFDIASPERENDPKRIAQFLKETAWTDPYR